MQAAETLHLPSHITTEADYQLLLEDAEKISHFDQVLFVDAALQGETPYTIAEVQPQPATSFSSHSASPGQLLELASQLFGANPRCWTLGIRGYVFDEFSEEISSQAAGNLRQALDDFKSWLLTSPADLSPWMCSNSHETIRTTSTIPTSHQHC
ncbi:MAG: hypothetical protein D6820_04895 [Lentisphaerae bacterium]|nr:MAG: hypothetical protein D6820_04895 [Lentisphaerota bacterium]